MQEKIASLERELLPQLNASDSVRPESDDGRRSFAAIYDEVLAAKLSLR